MPDTPAFELPPDWICEVLPPSTAGTDRVEKMQIYAREGVSYTWLVDPLAATLEIFALEGGTWARLGAFRGDARVRARPFQAIELDLAVL